MSWLETLQANEQVFDQIVLPAGLIALIVLIGTIELFFKAWALWRAARMHQRTWFIVLLLVNSAGILPIIYLLMTREEYTLSMTQRQGH